MGTAEPGADVLQPDAGGLSGHAIEVGGIPVQWEPEGCATLAGLPVIMAWVDTTLAGLLRGVHSMVGTKRFALALQREGRSSIAADWEIIRSHANFREGFEALSNIAAVAGWGMWELVELDEDRQLCRFRGRNSWEGRYQKSLGVCWGSAMLAGKLAGYCTKHFGVNCWADQTAYIARGAAADEFTVSPSSRSLEDELERLLESDDATRADMAVALRRLRQEMRERERAEANVRQFEDIVRNMRVGILIYNLEDPTDDRSLRLVRTNEAAEEMLGIDTDELVGRTIDVCFPNLREAGLPQVFARLTLNGGSLDLGDIHYTDSRVTGWYSVRVFSLPNHCVGVTFDDITERKQMEEKLVESREQLRELGRHMEASRERERCQVAEQVHEELGQVLAALRMQLARPCRPDEDGAGRHASLLELVDMSIATMRRITHELRPPELEHLGLGEAIRAECDRMAAERELDISSCSDLDDEEFDPDLAISLFRIIGAVLRTAVNMTTPKRIRVTLTDTADGPRLCVEIEAPDATTLTGDPDSLLLVELRERLLAWDGVLTVTTPAEGVARFCVCTPMPA